MTIKDGYYIWTNGDKDSINQYFNVSEFSCQCKHKECLEQRISVDLVTRLTTLREAVGKPLRVTSGFRCKAHQDDLRASNVNTVVSTQSQHELGNAADVQFRQLKVDDWTLETKKLFFTIGLSSTFLHLDTRPLKADGSYRIWKY